MDEIIKLLMADAELKKLVNGNIFPFGEATLSECLIYEFYTTQDNGIKATDTLMVTAVGYSISKSLAVLERVKAIITTLGDTPLTIHILKVSQNGGGSMKNVVDGKAMWHFKANFNIIRRVKR